ncbi:MAG: hypothetical protein LLF97_06680 [Planctomycetaceae bacterium]|nr:hypothetical protein [Planctomycetaceae bacterium]
MEKSDYASLVARAEEAVRSVKDSELRRVAFEKVLDDLLQGGAKPSIAHTGAHAKTDAKPARAKLPSGTRRGPIAYIEEILSEGFFKKPKTMAQVNAELVNRGHHIPRTSLSGPLQKLCQRKKLRRQKVKDGKKQTFAYSEW